MPPVKEISLPSALQFPFVIKYNSAKPCKISGYLLIYRFENPENHIIPAERSLRGLGDGTSQSTGPDLKGKGEVRLPALFNKYYIFSSSFVRSLLKIP
jgi:hypothetical protein